MKSILLAALLVTSASAAYTKKIDVRSLFLGIKGVKQMTSDIERLKKLYDKIDLEKFEDAVKMLESSNRKHIINRLGYVGYFQFGVQALEDLGYLRKGEYKRMKKMKVSQKTFITKYARWKKGLNLHKFLKYKQREAFRKFTKKNFENFARNGYLKHIVSEKVLQAILLSAHLVGVNSVKKFLKGQLPEGKKDANGKNMLEYFTLGMNF
jgi:hypothetical protein